MLVSWPILCLAVAGMVLLDTARRSSGWLVRVVALSVAVALALGPPAAAAGAAPPGSSNATVVRSGLRPAPQIEDDALPPPALAGEAAGLVGSASLAPGLVLPDPPTRKSVLDLLVLHTPGLRDRLGSGLEARIDHLVAVSNQALARSGVRAKLRVVDVVEVGYPDRGSNADALGRLTDGSHPSLAGVAALRDLYGADLVTLVRPFDNPTHGGCGTGWIGGWGGQPIAYANGFAYSVVSDGESEGFYCDDVSFIHEVSHNLGCMHDRATAAWQGGGQGAYEFGFGYGVSGLFGTVMSYVFPRVARFSNPDITCMGVACGIDERAPTSANNALAIELARADVARFRPAAQLDPGFGSAGRVLLGATGGKAAARAVAVGGDGRIVAAGHVERGSGGSRSSLAVARFWSDGSPDPTFGSGGLVEYEIGAARGQTAAVAVQVDGKIVLAGTLREGSASSLAILRLDPQGGLDPTFADGGVLIVERPGRRLEASALHVDVAGRILIAGTAEGTGADAGRVYAVVARVRARGSLDRRFGESGVAEQELAGGEGRIAALAVAPDGDIVVAGTGLVGPSGKPRFLAIRLRATGALDSGWASGGVALESLGAGEGGAGAVAVLPDGGVIAAGDWRASPTAPAQLAAVRWTATGRLDTGFADGGVFLLGLGAGDAVAKGVAIAADGRIVLAGSFVDLSTGDADFVVVRLRPNGRRDRGFANGGVAATDFPGRVATAHAIAVQGDGRIVAAGDGASGATQAFALVRHLRRPFQR
jgi:uncharacterized delta-60 repeat protein